MEDYVDITTPNYQPNDLKDLQPAARAVFERRVKHHEMISNLLENNMIEVSDQVKPGPKTPNRSIVLKMKLKATEQK